MDATYYYSGYQYNKYKYKHKCKYKHKFKYKHKYKYKHKHMNTGWWERSKVARESLT